MPAADVHATDGPATVVPVAEAHAAVGAPAPHVGRGELRTRDALAAARLRMMALLSPARAARIARGVQPAAHASPGGGRATASVADRLAAHVPSTDPVQPEIEPVPAPQPEVPQPGTDVPGIPAPGWRPDLPPEVPQPAPSPADPVPPAPPDVAPGSDPGPTSGPGRAPLPPA